MCHFSPWKRHRWKTFIWRRFTSSHTSFVLSARRPSDAYLVVYTLSVLCLVLCLFLRGSSPLSGSTANMSGRELNPSAIFMLWCAQGGLWQMLTERLLTVRFLDLIKPFTPLLPEVAAPESKTPFNQKLMWTGVSNPYQTLYRAKSYN